MCLSSVHTWTWCSILNIVCDRMASIHKQMCTCVWACTSMSPLIILEYLSHRGASLRKSSRCMKYGPPTWSPRRPTGPALVSFLQAQTRAEYEMMPWLKLFTGILQNSLLVVAAAAQLCASFGSIQYCQLGTSKCSTALVFTSNCSTALVLQACWTASHHILFVSCATAFFLRQRHHIHAARVLL